MLLLSQVCHEDLIHSFIYLFTYGRFMESLLRHCAEPWGRSGNKVDTATTGLTFPQRTEK